MRSAWAEENWAAAEGAAVEGVDSAAVKTEGEVEVEGVGTERTEVWVEDEEVCVVVERDAVGVVMEWAVTPSSSS
tara:strand:+ start:1314 stop:1538 length:225 start_codon:yes stop_codon:yes gene_type:complete